MCGRGGGCWVGEIVIGGVVGGSCCCGVGGGYYFSGRGGEGISGMEAGEAVMVVVVLAMVAERVVLVAVMMASGAEKVIKAVLVMGGDSFGSGGDCGCSDGGSGGV